MILVALVAVRLLGARGIWNAQKLGRAAHCGYKKFAGPVGLRSAHVLDAPGAALKLAARARLTAAPTAWRKGSRRALAALAAAALFSKLTLGTPAAARMRACGRGELAARALVALIPAPPPCAEVPLQILSLRALLLLAAPLARLAVGVLAFWASFARSASASAVLATGARLAGANVDTSRVQSPAARLAPGTVLVLASWADRCFQGAGASAPARSGAETPPAITG